MHRCSVTVQSHRGAFKTGGQQSRYPRWRTHYSGLCVKKVRLSLCLAENIVSSRCCADTTAHFCRNPCAARSCHPRGDARCLLAAQLVLLQEMFLPNSLYLILLLWIAFVLASLTGAVVFYLLFLKLSVRPDSLTELQVLVNSASPLFFIWMGLFSVL